MGTFRISPWLTVVLFVVGAMILRVVSRSVLHGHGGIPTTEEPEVELVTGSILKGLDNPPVFAYWISGTGGESQRILRLLKAVYHPRNHYLLHLDAGAGAYERSKLASSIQSEGVFKAFANVDVMGRAYAVDRTGSSVLAATLHGAAILLKVRANWDWFITLSASDYPIVTQDDLLHVFIAVPRDLNFIDHTSELGWKEHERFNKMIVDPSLYMDTNTQVSLATETRQTPDAFKIFTGSPWVILSRAFTEHCIHGWDNLPRKLLLYFTNVAYSMESYFQTVICNTPKFRNTTINNDLRYFLWDDPPGLDPLFLNQSNYDIMVGSGAAFARQFVEDDPVLQNLDDEILRRSLDGVGYGRWCTGKDASQIGNYSLDLCAKWGDINTVEPGASGEKLRQLVSELMQTRGCI